MSKIENFLIPSFLKRLDFWLMTHKPHIWRTKGHFVLFYCGIAAVLLYFLGRQYPQNFADFTDGDYMRSNDFAGYVTYFLCFLSIGIMAWWWYSIQKFGYKRTNIVHFLTEIGVYALGIYSVSLLIFGFEKGLSQRQVYELEKNKPEDSAWVVQNSFFFYGYMPHFQENKENNLFAYFKKGEDLGNKFYNRQVLVNDLLLKEDPKTHSPTTYVQHDNYDNYDNYGDYNRSTDPFSFSHWEYPSNQKKYPRPPQYPTPAGYVNKILSNDTFWKKEEKRLQFKDNTNVSREILTNMTFDEISNLIDEVYPKYFNRINYFNETQSVSRMLVRQWVEKRQFLESLSPQEISDYRAYLAWLKTNFALYAPQPIIDFERNAGYGYLEKRRYRITNWEHLQGRDGYLFHNNINVDDYFDQDKGELAGEKFLIFFDKLDSLSFHRYVDYLAHSGYQSLIKENNRTPQYKTLCQNYFNQYTPKSVVDSLYHYDYYDTKNINEHAWLNIIADNYAVYVIQKYSDADYTRLRNLLHINSFDDVYKKSSNPITQKLLQLHQAENYKMALETMQQNRYMYDISQKWKGRFFTLIWCIFLAIVFYIMTLSNSVQFWVSVFVSGFILGFIVFLDRVFPRYSLGESSFGTNSFVQFSMYLFCFSLLCLVIALMLKKVQLSRAHIWVNVVLFCGPLGILSALEYWTQRASMQMRTENSDYVSLSLDEKIQVYSFVMLAVISIYLLLAWLFKRHLTFPKKK